MTAMQAFDSARQRHSEGRLAEAEQLYRFVLESRPRHEGALSGLGQIALALGRPSEAVELLDRALAVRGDSWELALLRGTALAAAGRRDEAAGAFARSADLAPGRADAQYLAGHGLAQIGRTGAAIERYRAAVALRADFLEALTNLSNALTTEGRFEEAADVCVRALRLRGDFAPLHYNLGVIRFEQGDFGSAIAAYDEALRLRPDYAEAWNNLGSTMQETGRVGEGIVAFRRALALRPEYPDAASNLAFSLHYVPGISAEEIAATHRTWGETQVRRSGAAAAHANSRDAGRRLRVGYVSGDLRLHPVGAFMAKLLACHDRSGVEVFGYYTARRGDDVTASLRALCDGWREIWDVGYGEAAELIRRDEIDILVDLSGHSGMHRLPVFALRPAPVQVTYLGYCNTTGLAEMDYRLTDGIADTVGNAADARHVETLVRLPETFACYAPPAGSPEVSAAPCASRGYVTFGSFHRLQKLNDAVLGTWAEILLAVPASRLELVARWLDRPGVGERVLAFLAARGVERGRVSVSGELPFEAYLGKHAEVDIALDAFPFTGHTVACGALWMGVPVVTLAGEAHHERMVASVLTNVGLPELIATSRDGYREMAVGLARDGARLEQLRGELRGRVLGSALTDGPRFARRVEAAYREMWASWCAGRKWDGIFPFGKS